MPSTSPTVNQLVDQSIEAYKEGDKVRASELLAQALERDSKSEQAWLWLSGIVATDAERLFCIKRILAINPQNDTALYGLTLLPPSLVPVQPSLEKLSEQGVEICTFPGCHEPVSKSGHKFCYRHWKAVNTPLEAVPNLNATALGKELNLSSRRVNLILAELGWISKERKGWVLTAQGAALGAAQKEHPKTGIPFVLWPESLLGHKAFLATIKGLTGEVDESPKESVSEEAGFREKFAATHRTTDGHWVRSKAEMLIDNWLYMSGIVHAYERQLPIEEELYCDFYIPEGKVYLEYWGVENDSRYAARKKAKLEIYQKHKFNLIELTDKQIRNLDDFMPKLLLKFNVLIG